MGHGPTSEGGHPAMDYNEHNRTYAAFIRFSTIGTIWCLTLLVGLAIGLTGKSWGLGSLMITLGTIAALVGMLVKAVDYKASAGIFGASLLFWAMTALF